MGECRNYLNKPLDEAREGVELLIKVVTSLRKAGLDFDAIDINDDGVVTKEEFTAVLTVSGNFTEEQAALITDGWVAEKPRSSKFWRKLAGIAGGVLGQLGGM